jgi:tRNA (mo5U34)-methyltransferase
MLLLWLRRTGYTNLRLADLSRTTAAEQRSTPWMTFESLENFLSPQDHSKTIEGLPAPVRALILADRR